MERSISLLILNLCLLTGSVAAQPDATPVVILHRTQILTMSDETASGEALAIAGDRVVALGRNAEVVSLKGPQTEVKSLRERAVVPGFFASPIRLTTELSQALMANCSPPPNGRVRASLDVITELTRAKAKNGNPDGTWLGGHGYRESNDPNQIPLNARTLDLGFPDDPVYVLMGTGQGAICNSKALATLGISPDTADPPLGRIGRTTETSDQWGILWGAAWTQAAKKIPQPGPDQFSRQLAEVQSQFLQAGITTAWGGVVNLETYQALAQAERDNRLILDFVVYLALEEADALRTADSSIQFGETTKQLQLAGVAFDTEVISPLLPPEGGKPALEMKKSVPNQKVTPILDAEMGELLKRVIDQSVPVAIDCRSPEGLAVLMRSLARLEKLPLPGPSLLRTHLPLGAKELALLLQAGIVPAHATDECFFNPQLSEVNLGQDEGLMGPLHQLALKRGVEPLLFTNQPMTPQTAIFLWHSAVNRLSPGGRIVDPDQRLSPIQALRAMTLLPAQFAGRGERVGRLIPGQQADLVILDRNPYGIMPTRIGRIQVQETYKAGRRLYPN